MALPFAGLHQLSAPMLDAMERLPEPQREALSIVFGRSAGPRPLPRPRRSGTAVLPGLARTVDFAWRTASGGDLALPEVAGKRPLALRAVNTYIAWLLRSAELDAVLTKRFLRIHVFVDPPWKLVHPVLIIRGVLGALRRLRVRLSVGYCQHIRKGPSRPDPAR
jgi:hypothetical protein